MSFSILMHENHPYLLKPLQSMAYYVCYIIMYVITPATKYMPGFECKMYFLGLSCLNTYPQVVILFENIVGHSEGRESQEVVTGCRLSGADASSVPCLLAICLLKMQYDHLLHIPLPCLPHHDELQSE